MADERRKFTDKETDALLRVAHKEMFWREFGDRIAKRGRVWKFLAGLFVVTATAWYTAKGVLADFGTWAGFGP